MGVSGIERRLERLLEGTFTRTSRAGVQPAELVTRLRREMDLGRTLGTRGPVVPNDFTVALSDADALRLDDLKEQIEADLVEVAREHARTLDATFLGPIRVGLVHDDRLKDGRIEIEARTVAGAGGTAGSIVRVQDGTRLPLADRTVTIGRLSSCDLAIEDSRASRNHAEIRVAPDGYLLVDLQSTNGTLVNGRPVTNHRLSDGDVITIGAATLRFEAS
mgnify:CR=1 FL=1